MSAFAHDLLLALAAPPDGGAVSPWVQLIPFALVLGIFYFIILLPMRRRQKKVDEFLGSLKVGDKVVTTGGLYGSITRLGDASAAAADRRQGPRRDRTLRHRRVSGPGAGRRAGTRQQASQDHEQESSLESDRHPRGRRRCAPGRSTRRRRKSASASTSRAASTWSSGCRPTTRCGSRPRRRWTGCARSW